jgi:hypothetical protein
MIYLTDIHSIYWWYIIPHEHDVSLLDLTTTNSLTTVQALSGLRTLNVYSGLKMVPLKEISGVFRMVGKKGGAVKVDDLVRFKRGVYQGDLAQVRCRTI